MNNKIKFSLLKFKPGYYWSKTLHKKIWMNDIASIVWENEDLPVSMEILGVEDMIKFVIEHPGKDKKSRNAIMRIISERFPLKDYIGLDKWNGVIYIDLDMIHSTKFGNLDKECNELLYKQLDIALQNICGDNYFYIEHSSSGVGIHCMFYFDCERNEKNYNKFAKYIHDVFRYRIDEYLENFSSIFSETDGHEVFDSVYKRPYQKLYITGIDYKLYNINGSCDEIEDYEDVENDSIISENERKEDIVRGSFDVKYVTSKRKYDTDYYDRLFIITALKKYVGDYDKCKTLWYKFCENLTLYKNYTTNKFKNMLDLNWNKVKSETGHIEILKKYGFSVDESNLHLYLNDNEYISDVVNDIIKFCKNGLNLLNSGTGTGKTEVWKQWWLSISNSLEFSSHKSILIVEPMNSIIDSKYDSDVFEIITGSKKINITGMSKCYITNYNHLINQTFEGNRPRNDIEDFFNQFELVIIDESHIMIKDTFRSDVLIPFMQTLNKIKNTKVILQTATELFEKSILDIKRKVIIHKKEKANVKVIYRQAPEKFNISHIICLVNYYVSNGKKTYIYWKNGSLQNMNFIKKIYPEALIIYHKRDINSEDMKYINDEHKLGDVKVMISSVYFGVGNDLNDEIDDAAVIIIGNNVWQEDIQAKGRWRNAKNIEMCIITLPHEQQFINETLENSFEWKKRYDRNKYVYQTIYNDSINRDKSVIIGGKSFEIKDVEYIDYLAKMKTANEYSSQICIKNAEFKKLGYDVRENIKPLLTNKEWENELKEHRNNLKDIRNSNFKNFLNGEYDWAKINKDSTLERCARIIKKLQQKELIQYCDVDKFVKNKILRYDTFLRYYNSTILNERDLAELFSLLWCRNKIKTEQNKTLSFGDYLLKTFDYYCIYGYLIWLSYRNKNDNKDYINGKYFDIFCKKADDFCNLEDRLINRLFVKNIYDENYNKFIKEFLGSEIKVEEEINKDNLIEHISKIILKDEYLHKVMVYLSEYINDKNIKGRIGGKIGSPKKKCIITDKFKHPDKYNLTIGQEFESATQLSEYTKKAPKTISQWRNQGWVC